MRLRHLGVVGVLALVLAVMPAASAVAKQSPRAASGPQAQAACPWCIVAAGVAIRGALVVRTAAAVRTAVAISRYASPAFRRVVSRARLRRAVRSSRTVARKGRKWVRRNWNRLPKSSRACIKGAGLLSAEQIIDGGFVTEKEFDAWTLFYYPFLPPMEKAQFKAAVNWSEPLETAVAGCAVGWLAMERR